MSLIDGLMKKKGVVMNCFESAVAAVQAALWALPSDSGEERKRTVILEVLANRDELSERGVMAVLAASKHLC